VATTNWRDKAISEAGDAADHFADEIIEDIISNNGPTKQTRIDDYDSDYSHQLADTGYSLRQAADVLDELHEFEADDDSLWEGQPPRTAIDIMAAETFRNAVESLFQDLIKEINDAIDMETDVTIFWDADEWLQQMDPKKGVLDWNPDEEVTEEQQEAIEELHEKAVKNAVTELVKKKIKEWKE
jgi:hypothetical protein